MIETGSIVFPGDVSGEFHQLRVVELLTQAYKQSIGNLRRRVGHGVGIGEHDFFQIREHAAGWVVPKRFNLFLRDAAMSADGRPDVDSKRTPDSRGHTQGGEFLQRRIEAMARGECLLHLPISPKNCGMVCRDLHRHDVASQLALRERVDDAGEETAREALPGRIGTGDTGHEEFSFSLFDEQGAGEVSALAGGCSQLKARRR